MTTDRNGTHKKPKSHSLLSTIDMKIDQVFLTRHKVLNQVNTEICFWLKTWP